MFKKKPIVKNTNTQFKDSALSDTNAYFDYVDRLKKIALSIFEWENLPESMNARFLEECLYYDGVASLLYDPEKGFINTRACIDGDLNIYNLPTKLNCYSFSYQEERLLYTNQESTEENKSKYCIYVLNNYSRVPTGYTLDLFAERLADAELTASINIKAQKTPVLIVCDDKQRLTMKNLYSQYEGNCPVIYGDKEHISSDSIKSVKTDAPFIANDIMEYKKKIWDEALLYLGINTIDVEKKERLITGESNANNEVINLNLQSFLAPREEACKQFNKLFGLEGTDKEVRVRVRSDLNNIIKQENSIIKDYNNNGIEDTKEVEIDG